MECGSKKLCIITLLWFYIAVGAVTGSCPLGWVDMLVKCYKFSTTPAGWPQAEGICQDEGGHLAAIDTIQKSSFITGYIYLNKYLRSRTWYIGGYLEHGQWRWTANSQLMTYTNWAPSQPDYEREACAEINPVSGSLQWNNEDCHLAKPYICERNADNEVVIG